MSQKNFIKYWNCVAGDYKNLVNTPFYNEETCSNFYQKIEELLKGAPRFDDEEVYILDMGCGRGLFFEKLKKGFIPKKQSRVLYATDFSEGMVKAARETAKKIGLKATISLNEHSKMPYQKESFHEVYAVNTFLLPDRQKRYKAFSEAFRILKNRGSFIGLFPSNESYLEQLYIAKENRCRQGKTEEEAMADIYDFLDSHRYDVVRGIVDVPHKIEMCIKTYWKFELVDILEQTGFKNIQVIKYYYPSSMLEKFQEVTQSVYDWLVYADKNNGA